MFTTQMAFLDCVCELFRYALIFLWAIFCSPVQKAMPVFDFRARIEFMVGTIGN